MKEWIYEQVVQPCAVAIQNKNYEFAYNRYKSSVLALEEQFINYELENNNSKTLKRAKQFTNNNDCIRNSIYKKHLTTTVRNFI